MLRTPHSAHADLTLPRLERKSNRVSFAVNNFYARWRRQSGVVVALHEGSEPPNERLLQAVWLHQRLRRERLNTLDGDRVIILHPGFPSLEGGPDFRGAVIQFGSEPPVAGDVEVDVQSGGWKAHGHDRNPRFRSVILRVVWAATPKTLAGPPLLSLANSLDAPLSELAEWLCGEPAPALPDAYRGRCCAPLRGMSNETLQELLRQAALVRLRGKASQFVACARGAGWEQALWEGLFRALGYKHNAWPMQRLSELRSRWHTGVCGANVLLARLLGIANLLPAELTRARSEADGYVRGLWDCWWRERDAFEDCILPRSVWRLHGIRPLNHPQRRIALAAHWLADGKTVERLERWGTMTQLPIRQGIARSNEGEVRRPAKTPLRASTELAKILQPERDEFWSRHMTLRSARSAKRQLLLGEARVTDLAVNVILPWLLARAVEGRDAGLQSEIETRYFAWPAGEDNAVLKLARQRLLGGGVLKLFRTAASQQGLLQVKRDFCDHSNAICERCRFPGLVQAFIKAH